MGQNITWDITWDFKPQHLVCWALLKMRWLHYVSPQANLWYLAVKLTLCLPVCLCQEISGITEALAKELFHKGLLAFWTLTSFSNLGFTLLTINMSVAVGDIISSGHDVPNLYFYCISLWNNHWLYIKMNGFFRFWEIGQRKCKNSIMWPEGAAESVCKKTKITDHQQGKEPWICTFTNWKTVQKKNH